MLDPTNHRLLTRYENPPSRRTLLRHRLQNPPARTRTTISTKATVILPENANKTRTHSPLPGYPFELALVTVLNCMAPSAFYHVSQLLIFTLFVCVQRSNSILDVILVY